jgi:membrane-associated phospholipid phosphatase
VVSLALVYISVHVTKGALDRPRPPDSLVETSGDAYPSGHAAYATAWVAVAVVLTRRLKLVTSGVLVFVALAIAAAVGLTRVYLGAHWWSDVAGGWGLGAGIFAVVGGIALVVEFIRHNPMERAGDAPKSAAARGT